MVLQFKIKTLGGINTKEKNNQENMTALGLHYENFLQVIMWLPWLDSVREKNNHHNKKKQVKNS